MLLTLRLNSYKNINGVKIKMLTLEAKNEKTTIYKNASVNFIAENVDSNQTNFEKKYEEKRFNETVILKPEILHFSISPQKIKSGDEVNIKWFTKNATSISISGIGTVTATGGKPIRISKLKDINHTVITIKATNENNDTVSTSETVYFEEEKERPTVNTTSKEGEKEMVDTKHNNKIRNSILFSIFGFIVLFFILNGNNKSSINQDIPSISSLDQQKRSVPKTKDKFYYGAAQYLRDKNPNISQEEIFIKVDEYRERPEEFYANTYFELSGGKKITRVLLDDIAMTTNMNLSFDKIPMDLKQINIISYNTGDRPYSGCYNRNYICSMDCSQIKVIAPYNSDVVVTIKTNGRVVEHAFIERSDSYSFPLDNGTYETYFYFGSGGMDQDKFLINTSCGDLYGAFVNNQVFSKASEETLFRNILTYTLQLTENGNFSTTPSSVEQNF